jgi:hypothetical protein
VKSEQEQHNTWSRSSAADLASMARDILLLLFFNLSVVRDLDKSISLASILDSAHNQSMSQQTVNVADLDIAQLTEVRKQLEDVNDHDHLFSGLTH